MDRSCLLCVDDEPLVLEGLSLNLRRKYKVSTATGGAEGLNVIEAQGPFAVVLSDMRMPGMDGAAFLEQVRRVSPDTVRMMLTGHADIRAAAAAVNQGQIFRFLIKPCPADELKKALEAAVKQHRLITAERVLLEQTLHGSIRALTDILSMTSPVAFGRATRIRQRVSEMADALGIRDRWQIEVAAMLSQLGSITLPAETAEKYYLGQELSNAERAMVGRLPDVAEKLLANIPRLEPVREILAAVGSFNEADGKTRPGRNGVPLGTQLIRVAADFDELDSRGVPVQLALDTMRGRKGRYDQKVLSTFAELQGIATGQREVREVSLSDVSVGMVFAEDVKMKTGILLVARGYEVTLGFLERTRNFPPGAVSEPLRVIVRNSEREAPDGG